MTSLKNRKTKKIPPDGGWFTGWGWFATIGVSLVNLATRSGEPSFGLLFGDLLKSLNVGTTGASFIMSTLDISMNLSGLFVGPLLKEFSYRKVAVVGSLLCFIGFALTSPAQSMAHIIATYSIINGIGVGLATSAAFVALNHYFKKKRGQAVGLSMAGTALGMLIMPQLVRILLEEFDFRGAVLVLSGLALNAMVGAVLLQPVKRHMKEVEIDVEQELKEMTTIQEDEEVTMPEIKQLLYVNPRINELKKNFSEMNMGHTGSAPTMTNGGSLPKRPTFPRLTPIVNMSASMAKRKKSVISSLSHLDFHGSNLHVHVDTGDEHRHQHDHDHFPDYQNNGIRRVNTHLGMSYHHRDSFSKAPPFKVGSEVGLQMAAVGKEEKKPNFWHRFITLMDVGILKDRIYLNILFGLSSFYVAEMNFKMITPFFFASLGYSKTDTAHCLSMTAITDILARVVIPPICDKFDVSKRLVFFISIFFVGITRSIMAMQTEWNMLLFWLSICGFFRGAALSNFTLTVSEYCTLDKLPAAFGWHLVGKAVFAIIFGPLIGAVRDWTDSYPICIHVQTFFIFVCCLAWTIEIIVLRFRKDSVATEEVQSDTQLK